LSFSFSSVEDFLRKTRDAKTKQRPEIDERVRDYLEDPHLVGVAPSIADMLDDLLRKYGDESIRQIALFCLGKWFSIHAGVIEDLVKNEEVPAAMSASMDAARISDAIALLESVGSFGGDGDWKKMLHETLVSAVNDAMNQQEK
jgi:hypothetical protein